MKYLNDFLSEFKGGFQHANRFLCQIYVPQQMLVDISTNSVLMELVDVFFPKLGRRLDPTFSVPQMQSWLARGITCHTARLPDRDFEEMDLHLYGFTEKIAKGSGHSTFDVTFQCPLVTGDNALPRFFSYWQHYIQNGTNGPDSGYNFRFPNKYYGTIYLTTLDRKNNPTLTYQLDKVYPKTVSTTELGWETEGFLKLPVSFNYSTWKILPYQPPPLIDIEINL